MNYYKGALLGAILLSSSVVSSASMASGNTKSAVVDKSGSPVISILSRECVRTKWDKGFDECAPQQELKAVPEYTEPTVAPMKEEASIQTHKRSYIVFFDFNREVLTSDAKDILLDLFNDTKDALKVVFDLVGHADKSGSNAYNVRLSEKRAISVKDYLVGLGTNPEDINVNWKGESNPLIETLDGIKEPQNRRTEIKVTTHR